MNNKKDTITITTILGRGTGISGDFEVDGSARIDGEINGDVKVNGTLIIGAEGRVLGDIEAYDAIIGGEVNGNVTAENKTELIATAKLLGDLVTKVLVIDENAVFQGKCNMNQDVTQKKNRKTARILRTEKKSARDALQEALREVAEENQKEESLQQAE